MYTIEEEKTVRAFRSSILSITSKQKSHTSYDFFILYERDGFTVTAIFISIYAVLKGFTLISTKA